MADDLYCTECYRVVPVGETAALADDCEPCCLQCMSERSPSQDRGVHYAVLPDAGLKDPRICSSSFRLVPIQRA